MAKLRPRPGPLAASSPVARARPARRWLAVLLAAAAIMLVLGLAWLDGGERALRPIAEPVALPGARP